MSTLTEPTVEQIDAARIDMDDAKAVRILARQETYDGPLDVADYLFESIDQGDEYALRIIALAFLDAVAPV